MTNNTLGLSRFSYAGIGSRSITQESSYIMMRYACAMAMMGGCVRSGGASGSDTSFEAGAKIAYDAMAKPFDLEPGAYSSVIEIHLPWNNFNGLKRSPKAGYHFSNDASAFDMAALYHPRWKDLSQAEKKLMARNSHQVMGLDMRSPSKFLICQTPDGAYNRETITSRSGGTGQAIRIADVCDIKVYNLKNKNHLAHIIDWLETIDVKIQARLGLSPKELVDNYIKNESIISKRVSGNIVEMAKSGYFDVIVHGVNCQGVMNAGAAKEIREAFPQAYQKLLSRGKPGKGGLGEIDVIDIETPSGVITVVNAYTQLNYGRNKDVLYVDYDAVRKSFTKIASTIEKGRRIGITKIGSGLGNGCWTSIGRTIKNELEGHDVTLVEFGEQKKIEISQIPEQNSLFVI